MFWDSLEFCIHFISNTCRYQGICFRIQSAEKFGMMWLYILALFAELLVTTSDENSCRCVLTFSNLFKMISMDVWKIFFTYLGTYLDYSKWRTGDKIDRDKQVLSIINNGITLPPSIWSSMIPCLLWIRSIMCLYKMPKCNKITQQTKKRKNWQFGIVGTTKNTGHWKK